jgi:hypothetical protein
LTMAEGPSLGRGLEMELFFVGPIFRQLTEFPFM